MLWFLLRRLIIRRPSLVLCCLLVLNWRRRSRRCTRVGGGRRWVGVRTRAARRSRSRAGVRRIRITVVASTGAVAVLQFLILFVCDGIFLPGGKETSEQRKATPWAYLKTYISSRRACSSFSLSFFFMSVVLEGLWRCLRFPVQE